MATQNNPKSGIVIFTEKHGTYAYDIEKSGGWPRLCMAIVRERYNSGDVYRQPPMKAPTPPAPIQVATEEEALELAKKWKQYRNELDYFNADDTHWKWLQAALGGSFSAAVKLIEARGAHEYRDWEEMQKYKNHPDMEKWAKDHSGYQYETYQVYDLQEIPADTLRYKQDGESASLALARVLERLLHTNANDNAGDWDRLDEAIEKASETTNEPTDGPLRADDSTCPLRIGWEGVRNRMIKLARRYLQHGDNWWIQDEVRWECARLLGDSFDDTRLATLRMKKLGSVEAVGRKRFEDFIELGTKKTAENHAEARGVTVEERINQHSESTQAWLKGEPHMGASVGYRSGLGKR